MIGAVVAGIIAAIGAIIGLFVAVAKLLKKGAETTANNAKAAEKAVKDDASKKVDTPPEVDPRIAKIIKDYNDALAVDEIKTMLKRFSDQDVSSILSDCLGENLSFGVSTCDISNYVEMNNIHLLNDSVEELVKDENMSSKSQDKILQYFGESSDTDINIKMNKFLFTDQVAYGVKANNSISDIFMTLYNKEKVDYKTVLENPKHYSSEIDSISKNSQKRINIFNKVLGEIESNLTTYKNREIKKRQDNNESIKKNISIGRELKASLTAANDTQILKITSYSTKTLKGFATVWQTIETKRLGVMNALSTKGTLLIRKAYKQKIYEYFASKYGDDFIDNVASNNN
jgi:hypothetical protein